MLSIIIPTFNEEKYLPLLLKSIKKHPEAERSSLRGSPVQSSAFVSGQNFQDDFEIIVSDADSKDRTRGIAQSCGCKIVKGGLPAKGRNLGASAAQGDLFLFLDAEVILPDKFLERILKEFKERNLDIAGCGLTPIGTEWVSKAFSMKFLYNLLYNWPIRFLQGVFPYAASLILVKKEIHEKLEGFDETIKIAEDHDYVRRAAKIGKFGFLKPRLPLFLRRCEREGLLRTNAKYFFCNLFNVFLGSVRTDIFRYNFGQYRKKRELKGQVEKKRKTNFFLQCLWVVFSYFLIGVGFFGWIIIFLLFTPKMVILRVKNILKR